MIKFPKIRQFRDIIREIKVKSSYHGRDEDGNPIYGKVTTLPTIKYVGTVKLHGSNASLVKNTDGTLTAQSRNRVLAIDNDNAGFAAFAFNEIEKSFWDELFEQITSVYGLTNEHPIVIYGEWCGSNIQKGVALTQIPNKMFIIFAIRQGIGDDTKWFDPRNLTVKHDRIKNIFEYQSWEIDINFDLPGKAQNQIIEITNSVEAECPVGKAFGISSTGEGVVWRQVGKSPELWFKVKGKKHSISKVKTLAPIDVEKMKSVSDFVTSVLTNVRFEQGIEYLKENNHDISRKSTGIYLSWIFADIMSEESDTMEASCITKKDLGKPVGNRARDWFFNYLDTDAGL